MDGSGFDVGTVGIKRAALQKCKDKEENVSCGYGRAFSFFAILFSQSQEDDEYGIIISIASEKNIYHSPGRSKNTGVKGRELFGGGWGVCGDYGRVRVGKDHSSQHSGCS